MKIISLEIKKIEIGKFFPKENKVELSIFFNDGADKEILKVVDMSDPEIAAVGLSEEEAKAKGMNIKAGKFPFSASSRAMTRGSTQGFVKIISKIN